MLSFFFIHKYSVFSNQLFTAHNQGNRVDYLRSTPTDTFLDKLTNKEALTYDTFKKSNRWHFKVCLAFVL